MTRSSANADEQQEDGLADADDREDLLKSDIHPSRHSDKGPGRQGRGQRCQCEGRLQTPLYITSALVFAALVAVAFIFAPWDHTATTGYAVLKARAIGWTAVTHQQVSIGLASNSPFPNAGNLVVSNFQSHTPSRTTASNTSVHLTNIRVAGASHTAYPLYLVANPTHQSRLVAAFSSAVALLVFRGTGSYQQWQSSGSSTSGAVPVLEQPGAILHNLTFAFDQVATYWFVFVNERPSGSGTANGDVQWTQLLQDEYDTASSAEPSCTPQRDAPCFYDIAWGGNLNLVVQMSSLTGSGSPIYKLRIHSEARPTFYWLMVTLGLLILAFLTFVFCLRQRKPSQLSNLPTERSSLLVQQPR